MDVMIYHTSGESETVPLHVARDRVAADRNWSMTPHPPRGWQFETPRYQARETLLPARHARYLTEPPHAHEGEAARWQYGTEEIVAGQIVETTAWPHRTFAALNHSAKTILQAFLTGTKSRMTASPWRDGRVWLDDGLAFGPVTAVHESKGPETELRAGPAQRARGARPRVM